LHQIPQEKQLDIPKRLSEFVKLVLTD